MPAPPNTTEQIQPQILRSDLSELSLSATVFLPDGPERAHLVCLPGGGASAEYFDLAPDYSFARAMQSKGYRVITIDHPGTATNPLPADHPFLRPRQSAAYVARALPDFLGASDTPVIGVGHSMGGMMTTLLQAHSNRFSAVALLGSSAGGLEWGLSDDEKVYMDNQSAFTRDIKALTLAKFKTEFPAGTGGPSGKSITFGGQTPELTRRLQETSCALCGAGGMMSMTRGSFQTEVEALDIPLFFAFGDHDIGIAPHEAPSAYINAPRAEVHILENTGHNSFAFDSLTTLCANMDEWISRQLEQ